MAKLFPHDVIEGLKVVEDTFDRGFKKLGPKDTEEQWDTWFKVPFATRSRFFSSMRASLEKAVIFDFDKLKPHAVHTEFAAQMFEHSDFTKFQPMCAVINYDHPGIRVLHLLEPGDKEGLIYSQFSLHPTARNVLPVATLIDAKLEHYDQAKHPKLASISDTEFRHGDITIAAADIAVLTRAKRMGITDDQGNMKQFTDEKEAQRAFAHQLAGDFGYIMGLYAMMSCREVEKVTVPAPQKLNKKRSNAHKPIIKERTEVKINLSTPKLDIHYEHDEITPRGSPRPHWRRGHPRRLHKSGIVKLIPPTWVLWDEDSPLPRPKIKDYKVT